jgi:hypothetical protein
MHAFLARAMASSSKRWLDTANDLASSEHRQGGHHRARGDAPCRRRCRLRQHVARVHRRHRGLRAISECRPPGSEDPASGGTRERSRPTRSSRSTRLHVSMAAGIHLAVTNEYSPDLLDGPSPYASPSNHPVQQPVRHRKFAARALISAPRHRHWSRSGWQLSWCACHSVQSTCQHKSIRSRQEPFRLVMRAGNRVTGDRFRTTSLFRALQRPIEQYCVRFASVEARRAFLRATGER